MKFLRTVLVTSSMVLAVASYGQAWSRSYEQGLASARAGNWSAARASFLEASSNRPEDSNKPTRLPGPISEQRQWRGGALYSPNFLAAYSAMRLAVTSKEADAATKLSQTASDEFAALVDRGQASPETVYFLSYLLNRLGKQADLQALSKRVADPAFKMAWSVDTEVVDPQEVAMAHQSAPNAAPVPVTSNPSQTVNANQLNPSTGMPTAVSPSVTPTSNPNVSIINMGIPAGAFVPALGNKYALVIGNSQCKIAGLAIPFAADDALAVKAALVNLAGYPESNVETVVNESAKQVLAKASELAARLPEGSTLTLFYAGAGVNLGGKDFLVCADAGSPDREAGMVSKAALYQAFVSRGAHIFAFFESNRAIKDGHFFGEESPILGAIAQAQATAPGETVYSIQRGGKQTGLYTDAFVAVLNDFRSNRVPIGEFGWQVFYRIRRGDSGSGSGGSPQTPTLPTLKNLASDARF